MDPYLKMLMAMESGGQNIINHSGATSATGLYGFTKPAFRQVQIDNPELRNVTWEQFQQTPDIQHTFAAKLKDSVTNRMSNKGIPVTPLNVYKYWFLGPSGAENFLNKAPETPLSQAMSPEAIAANPWVNKFQTVGGLSSELNRRIGQKVNMETPAQQTAQPSFAQLEAALARARAANNPAAVEKLSKMLQEPLSQARVRALEAGNEVALNKIIQRMQALGFDPTAAAPSPVVPPGPTQITEAPVAPGPDTLGTPSQAPDFDPSQRDMGSPGTPAPVAPVAPIAPAAAPEAPIAPVAAPVAPPPQLAPAAAPAAPVAAPMAPPVAPAAPRPRTTAEIVSGETAPVVTLPTTVVTAGPQRNLTDSGFESDPTWIGNAKRIYQETQGKAFEGADADAAKWLKNYVAQTKWNMGSAGLTIYDAMNKLSPEGKAALLQSIKEYGDAPTSGESVLRGLKGVATDPTTYLTAGVGNLITKTIGKKGAEVALRKAIEEGIKKQTFSTATKQAAASGAGYSATGNVLDQGVQVAADGQESIDPTQVATSAAGGAVVGAGASKIIDKLTGRGKVRDFAAKAGTEERARLNAEVTKDFQEVAQNPNLSATNEAGEAVVATALRNSKAKRYVDDVELALKRTDPALLKQFDVEKLLTGTRSVTPEEIATLKATPGGEVLGNALEKYQVAMSLTAPTPANPALLAKLTRGAIQATPRVAAAATGFSTMGPAGLALGAIGPNISGFAQRLTGKSTVPEVITKMASDKNVTTANKVLELLGPSQAKAQADDLFSRARAAEAAQAAKKVADAAKAAKAEADSLTSRNSVLQATGMPLGGPFQELLQGGRSGLNMTTDQAVEALRIAANKNKGNPVGEAANQVRRSSPDGVTDTNAFYGLQNELRKLQERGVLGGQPGALSGVTQGSGIRNPISYAANVRTAEAALKVAQESAPSNALAQFANVVAGLKSPEAKAALVQQRLMRTKDPVEVEYLTNFIEPLTRFGAKSK